MVGPAQNPCREGHIPGGGKLRTTVYGLCQPSAYRGAYPALSSALPARSDTCPSPHSYNQGGNKNKREKNTSKGYNCHSI